MTPEDREILREHGEALASINTNIELLRKDLNGRLPKLEDEQKKQAEQINLWRGAIGVIIFLLLLVGGSEAAHIFHLIK